MDNRPPPYRPFRGAQPPHFVDRADPEEIGATGIVATCLAACKVGPGDPRFHRLVVSTPALGKTALARAIGGEVAGRLGWVVVFHRCRPKERALHLVATEALAGMQRLSWARARGAHPAGRDLMPVPQLRRLVAGGGAGPWRDLKEFFSLAGSWAQHISRGLMVVLDDADRLSGAEVECAGHLARSLSRDRLPVALLLTGGPQLGRHFARTGHFSGTVWPTRLARFDDSEAREALVVPAAERGVEFHEKALELLCPAASGLPLQLQSLGLAAWSTSARRSGRVRLADAEQALGLVAPAAVARAC
jgi:hypothetical protein